MTLRITQDELVSNVPAVLEQIERGSDYIVEGTDHRPIALIKPPQQIGRTIPECIALAKAHEGGLSTANVPDAPWSEDLKRFVNSRRESLRNVWDD